MKTVDLTPEQRAILARNLQSDKRVINAQRREAKRLRDEQRKTARTQKADALEVVAALIDISSNVKVGKTWVY